jgi:hypothetical protein
MFHMNCDNAIKIGNRLAPAEAERVLDGALSAEQIIEAKPAQRRGDHCRE